MSADLKQRMREGLATTAQQLNGMGCSVEGCMHAHDNEELYFHARCHPASSVETVYYAGRVLITCTTCGKQVVLLEIK
jgi:hypothetical protein